MRPVPARAVAIVLAGILAPQALAADLPAGATGCSGCHAPAGRVASSSIPPINGLSATDLTAAMEGFRSEERPAKVMGRIVKGFTPDEIRALAAWLEQQR